MTSLSLSASDEELRDLFSQLTSREDVAKLLDVTERRLIYYLYIASPAEKYTIFEVPKRNGELRAIAAPANALKLLQRKLNSVLQAVYVPKKPTHGFVRDRDILSNAQPHLRKKWVLNVDLKDFFPSINFGRVRGMFMAPPYRHNATVATILAQICCHLNQLPQGAPTSPVGSNMICAKLDSDLQFLGKKYRCLYTRYADDITFSSFTGWFPPELAGISETTGQTEIGQALREMIEANGFQINDKKTRLNGKARHQEVTGITINEKPNVSRHYVRQIRAMLHAWEKFGLDAAEQEFRTRYMNSQRHPTKQLPSFRHVVKGKIEFLGMVRGEYDSLYLNFLCELGALAPDLVRAAPAGPQVRCRAFTEGKTDVIHLMAALGNLQSKGLFTNLEIEFNSRQDVQGGDALQKMCEQRARAANDVTEIYMFDRDVASVLRNVTQEGKEYKTWGNKVYSFALPIPSHRDESPDVCIELYYKDDAIKIPDADGRRLFLSNEFHPRSGNHKQISNLHFQGAVKDLKCLKVIDHDVYNENHENVALTKSHFAECIRDRSGNFANVDISEFSRIFGMMERILIENP